MWLYIPYISSQIWDFRRKSVNLFHMGRLFGALICVFLVLRKWGVESSELGDEIPNATSFVYGDSAARVHPANTLMVKYTLVEGAAAIGAVCLDGSSPAYHLHGGFGSGANSWLIQLEGGGWCNSLRTCRYRTKTCHGSSNHMKGSIPFIGILSNKPDQNPDFYSWNRVKIRYCDGASFSGYRKKKVKGLYFRGRVILHVVMKELMSKGMKNAEQVLLSGCSAGGLASILHCDRFRKLFPINTKVKCLSDAGLFLDATDVSGGRTLRSFYEGVVNLQNIRRNLTGSCHENLDRTSCFFPQNLIANIKTPLFILNAAYDAWQVQESLAPLTANLNRKWDECRLNINNCSQSQNFFLKGFRTEMVEAVKGFSGSRQNGLFLNSCFAHCQSERQDTWFADNSPVINKTRIALAVGDWYFERAENNLAIGCEDCNKTCHNLVFR